MKFETVTDKLVMTGFVLPIYYGSGWLVHYPDYSDLPFVHRYLVHYDHEVLHRN